jgi:hypothetical protein
MRARYGWHVLFIGPVKPYRTKEISSDVVIETAIAFDVASEWRVESLSFGGYPVDDNAFQALGIVGTSTGDTFLNL